MCAIRVKTVKVLFDHIEEKLNELRFFLEALEEAHGKHLEHVKTLRRPFEGEGRRYVRHFQYCLSAYLSAHRAVRYYVIRISGRVSGTREWRAAIDKNIVLEALHHLRDVEIHDETVNLATTVRMTDIQSNPTIYLSGLMLDDRSLAAIKRVATHPESLEYLTSRSVIEICREGVSTLERVVQEGRDLHYLDPQPLSGYS
jgi:hypothetical protein